MLLQCETHDGTCGEGWGLAERWLHPETLESLVELNELCLGLFAEQAAVRGGAPPPVPTCWWTRASPTRSAGGSRRRWAWAMPGRPPTAHSLPWPGRTRLRGWCSPTPGTWRVRRAPRRGCCSV